MAAENKKHQQYPINDANLKKKKEKKKIYFSQKGIFVGRSTFVWHVMADAWWGRLPTHTKKKCFAVA